MNRLESDRIGRAPPHARVPGQVFDHAKRQEGNIPGAVPY